MRTWFVVLLSLAAVGCDNGLDRSIASERAQLERSFTQADSSGLWMAYSMLDEGLKVAAEEGHRVDGKPAQEVRAALRTDTLQRLKREWPQFQPGYMIPERREPGVAPRNLEHDPLHELVKALNDPELDRLWSGLVAAANRAQAEDDARQAVAADPSGKLLVWLDGDDDPDLSRCALDALGTLAPGAIVERMALEPDAASRAKAAGTAAVHVQVEYTAYQRTGDSDDRVQARIPSAVTISMDLRLKGKKRPAHVEARATGESPGSFAANADESAANQASEVALRQTEALWKSVCGELRAKARRLASR